jgi:multidrug transporter EmrE-like cation transporter
MRDYYAWPILLVAAVFEMGFAIGLKYSDGFTRLWPSLATVITTMPAVWEVVRQRIDHLEKQAPWDK